MAPSADDDQAQLQASLMALRQAALRGAAAGRFHVHSEDRLLQLIVDATVSLFEAEAASIALFEREPDRLEFRVAGGARGAGAVGMSVEPTEGIAGYAFSTGESVALTDISSDPRFDREAAERTGYVPRSIAAVPLYSGDQTVGVLQVPGRSLPTAPLHHRELRHGEIAVEAQVRLNKCGAGIHALNLLPHARRAGTMSRVRMRNFSTCRT